MTNAVARLGDQCTEALPHFCIGGSHNVFVNNKPIARELDSFTEGKAVIQGSNKVFANGFGIARVGDLVSCGFRVVSGSRNVFSG